MGVYGKSNTGIGVFGESVGIGVKGYSSSDSSGVYGYSLYGPSIKGVGKYSYSAKFTGGLGVVIEQGLQTDSATIGNGSTISRSGTIAEKDIWTGTQAEYDLLTPVSTTLYFIHNGYGIFGIIFLMLLSFGSKAQNWTAVKVGSTDINRIYQGGNIS